MLRAYTDGSYKMDSNRNYGVGWGYVLLDEGDNIIHQDYGTFDEYIEQRNVSGEVFAVISLIMYCEENGVQELEIYHDYVGIEHWVTGVWRAKNEMTMRYRDFMQDSPIKITFNHVRGHTGNKWNEYVDKLAKRGVEEK